MKKNTKIKRHQKCTESSKMRPFPLCRQIDADREFPTRGYRDPNPRVKVYLVTCIIRLPHGLDFSVCIGNRRLVILLTYYQKIVFLVTVTMFPLLPKNYCMTANSERHTECVVTALDRRLSTIDVTLSRVSCLSPWARQNFSAPLKIKQILSHR